MVCYIDCRTDPRLSSNFSTLNLCGKPVFAYAIDTVVEAAIFESIVAVTESEYVAHQIHCLYGDTIYINRDFKRHIQGKAFCVVSGRAPFLLPHTLQTAYDRFCINETALCSVVRLQEFDLTPFFDVAVCVEFIPVNAFCFCKDISDRTALEKYELSKTEGLVINDANNFELALVLKGKEKRRTILDAAIQKRIAEKEDMLRGSIAGPSICFVGHSQIDNWNIELISGFKVRNCGIRGISSLEYKNLILAKGMLNCCADMFLVMHGTNDIVGDFDLNKVCLNIADTVHYIRVYNDSAPIMFLECAHVNGRMDRDNNKIAELNLHLKQRLQDVIWVSLEELDDQFGNLNSEYTEDGLHFNARGYKCLQGIVERAIYEIG